MHGAMVVVVVQWQNAVFGSPTRRRGFDPRLQLLLIGESGMLDANGFRQLTARGKCDSASQFFRDDNIDLAARSLSDAATECEELLRLIRLATGEAEYRART